MNTASQNFTHVFLATTALIATLFAAAPAQAGHEVVMQDGRRIAASTRPIIALGRVNFHDAQGRAISLSATAVNLPATRQALRRELGPMSSGVWTAERLAANKVRVQVLGGSSANADGADADDAESMGELEEDASPSWFQERKSRIKFEEQIAKQKADEVRRKKIAETRAAIAKQI